MNKELEIVKASIKSIIQPVIDNEDQQAILPRIPVRFAIDIMEELGYTYEQETNGFSIDFWIVFWKDGVASFELSGDLWYDMNYKFNAL